MTTPPGSGPFFTVIMATYGRGRHILPSVRSVLGQSFGDFELIVVGDACTDETEAVVADVTDPRVRWLNLPNRIGSQSGPNNAGIAAARSGYIAYLGHDDIWEPDHLERLAALYFSPNPPDFAVSGTIFHLPNGLPGSEVMGIFADGADVSRYFFPPSSFSHRKYVTNRIGPWRMPMEIRAPVDLDLLLRAQAAGMRFRSTGVVTLHKFAAGHRYLSYVRHDSHEQESMLADLSHPGHAARVVDLVAAAKAAGRYMFKPDCNFDKFKPGAVARRALQMKGLREVSLRPLQDTLTVRHRIERSRYDWHIVPFLGFRWTRANPRPRLLLPVTGGKARLRFLALHKGKSALGPLSLICNGVAVTAHPGPVRFGVFMRYASYTAEICLHTDKPSLLEFVLEGLQRPLPTTRGIAIGSLHLTSLPARGDLRQNDISCRA